MNRNIYRYTFDANIPHQEIEDSLLLAVMAAESLHGRSPVRLDASFYLDTRRRICVVDSTTEIGQAIARIFNGFLTSEFGEAAFKVERVAEAETTTPEQRKMKGTRKHK